MAEVIVKYNGDLAALGYPYEILNANYAILTLPDAEIPWLNNYTEIEYVEIPKRLSLVTAESMDAACIPAVQNERGYGLNGEGVLVAVIDSGIDYRHADFRHPNGSTRIAFIWDQTLEGRPPAGFLYGTEFSRAQINEALENPNPLSIVPHQDYLGHGTAVAGIAAGNGRASNGQETGAAPNAAIIAVKLGERNGAPYTRTTEIVRAIKYVYDKAQALNQPLAVNISYGTNDGAHDGRSLFESYLNDMAEEWKSVIVTACGNEGAAGHHYRYKLRQGETVSAAFSVGSRVPALTLGLWKNFVDTFTAELTAPSGTTTGVLQHTALPSLAHMGGAGLRVLNIQPSHYTQNNGILLSLQAEPEGASVPLGIWTLQISGEKIVDGRFDIWLPTVEEVTNKIAFLTPSPEITLTLPSCAEKVISVGGYDASNGSYAVFSGRGYTREHMHVKPDLSGPAVQIRSCRPGGGYGLFTGTSFAAPFVTGSAALMMQWGILQGHDPYLYGQRLKSFLQKGAGRDISVIYPNNRWGYGTLCLKGTMDYLTEYVYL